MTVMAEKTEGMNVHKEHMEDMELQKQEGGQQQAGDGEKRPGDSAFEGIYDRMPDISIGALDRFIFLCIIALVAVVAIGIMKANHVF